MSLSRQARYFRETRENWKNKAQDKQDKLRANDQKIRDLSRSRDKWKARARQERQKVKALEKEVEKLKKKLNQLIKSNPPMMIF